MNASTVFLFVCMLLCAAYCFYRWTLHKRAILGAMLFDKGVSRMLSDWDRRHPTIPIGCTDEGREQVEAAISVWRLFLAVHPWYEDHGRRIGFLLSLLLTDVPPPRRRKRPPAPIKRLAQASRSFLFASQ